LSTIIYNNNGKVCYLFKIREYFMGRCYNENICRQVELGVRTGVLKLEFGDEKGEEQLWTISPFINPPGLFLAKIPLGRLAGL
jgi:hypothetical protein